MKTKIIAELSTFPVGLGTSLSEFVKKAVKEIDSFPKIRVIHHPMGTVIEADSLDQVFSVTKLAHEAILNAGADRVITQLKIDDRRDKARVMEDKIEAIKE
ncbi:MAG: MTH1187 family thiamine-binding protein [Candidatus Heimdallarchaeota archaeon]